MPEIKLKKSTPNEVVEAFLTWDNDPEAKAAYSLLVEQTEDSAASTMAQLCFWAGVWYAKTHPEEIELDEDGAKRPDRPLAPLFV